MASSSEEEAKTLAAQLGKPLKDGERMLAPTRRPDGTLRKPIRIRAGYVPQEEVAIYQSKGALWRKEMESQAGPPGYDPSMVVESKTKSVKRNERKKEKRLQAALEKAISLEDVIDEGIIISEEQHPTSESAESITTQISQISLSAGPSDSTPAMNATGGPYPGNTVLDIDKKIRALKKKIRLTEAMQQKISEKDINPEQLDKVGKLEGWCKELKFLEDKKAEMHAS